MRESGFDASAIGDLDKVVKSLGMFQIQLRTAKRYCGLKKQKDLFNAELNVYCAGVIMRHHLDQYKGDMHQTIKALLTYNAGGYYPCTAKHKARGVACLIGLPVNFDYVLKMVKNEQALYETGIIRGRLLGPMVYSYLKDMARTGYGSAKH